MLKNIVTIVTGASQGIGRACAERFTQERAKVVLSDINDSIGQETASQITSLGGEACYKHCDVSDKVQLEALFDFTIEKYGRVDSVIANAGIAIPCDILELTEQDFDKVISINLKGVFLTGQIAAQRMINQTPDENKSKGTIINMSSLNGILAIPAIAPYVVAKGGVNQWTKCLGIRMANEGVRVNGIAPGSIATDMFNKIAENPQKRKEIMSRTPMLRPGEPDEVAKAAVFLASNYSSYMTGETIYVDGGRQGLNYFVPVPD